MMKHRNGVNGSGSRKVRHNRSQKRTLRLDKEHKKFLGVCAGVAEYLEVEPWTVRLVFIVSVFFGGWFLIPLYFIAWFCLDDKASEGVASLADSQPLKHLRTVDYKKKLYRNTEDGKFLGICAGVADYLEINVFAVRLFFLASMFFAAALPLFLYFGAYFILEEKPHRRLRRTGAARRDRHARREERYRKRKSGDDPISDEINAAVSAVEESINSAFQEMGDAFSENGKNTEAREAEETEYESGRQYDEETDSYNVSKYSKRREFKYCARKFATLQDRLKKMEAYVTSNQFRLHREFKNI